MIRCIIFVEHDDLEVSVKIEAFLPCIPNKGDMIDIKCFIESEKDYGVNKKIMQDILDDNILNVKFNCYNKDVNGFYIEIFTE